MRRLGLSERAVLEECSIAMLKRVFILDELEAEAQEKAAEQERMKQQTQRGGR